MSEDFKEVPCRKADAPFTCAELVDNKRLARIQEVAPNFGVTIQVLAKDGEKYTHDSIDPRTEKPSCHTGLVPENKSYIGISNPKGDLSDFWNAVRVAEKAAKAETQQAPANPPKI